MVFFHLRIDNFEMNAVATGIIGVMSSGQASVAGLKSLRIHQKTRNSLADKQDLAAYHKAGQSS